jgi:hypothetical protein
MAKDWIKGGLIYTPTGKNGWDLHTFITPTPVLTGDVIRIYGGFRDDKGVSRISYVDVDANDPLKILFVPDKPCIDIGRPGTFDDNGMILGSIINVNDELWMYYVGFQLVQKVKFLAYSGLAVSRDEGKTFQRFSDTPIFDRHKDELYIRAIHTVIKENDVFKIWYSTGNGWEIINGIAYPQYHIRYTESENGIDIPDKNVVCILPEGDEYRIGRPTVFMEDNLYKMYYTRDTKNKMYSPGYAESSDGINWLRKDNEFTLERSPGKAWDNEMICYPVPVKYKNKEYLFYSGNNMGMTGVGYAYREI